MKQWKRKTATLVLASVISVVGAFGAEDFKNSLMSLVFERDQSGAVNVTLQTKKSYASTVIPKKQNSTTYIIMLPETEGRKASYSGDVPDIEDVNIRTVPYTSNGKGYTKITIKTSENTVLNAKKELYVPPKPAENVELKTVPQKTQYNENVQKAYENKQKTIVQPQKAQSDNNVYVDNTEKQVSKTKEPEVTTNNAQPTSDDNGLERLILILGFLVVIISVVYLYIRGRNKMAEILGEQTEFSLEEEKPNKKQNSAKKQVGQTIKKLDKMYKKPYIMPTNSINTVKEDIIKRKAEKTEEKKVDNVIVDLDELFQETKEPETNEALDDFLKNFSFEEAEEPVVAEEEYKIDEEAFEKYIVNGKIKFSRKDVEKINQLLNTEISDETINNISKYVVSVPIKSQKPTRKELLENFVLDFGIKKNITFTEEDIKAINKLMEVELDGDFVSNLATNPARVDIVRKEIENKKVSHKSHGIMLLNVKDVLPDLSKELKKHSGKYIKSEAKPDVVYYSKGYDVSMLTVNKDDLPDLTIDLDKSEFNKYRPSDEIGLSEAGYEVETLSTNGSLPDLADAINNPEKYEEKKEVKKADENSLLQTLSNVEFKPFYDGDENLEILNKFSDTEQISNFQEDFENTEQEDIDKLEPKEEILLDSQAKSRKTRNDENARKLMELIEAQRIERYKKAEKIKEIRKEKELSKKNQNNSNSKKELQGSFDYKGLKYNIISSVNIAENIQCRLAQSYKGYVVFGCIEDKIVKLHSYETINSQRMQIRLNEKNDNGEQYLVRLGKHKFIINVTLDDIEYVMDLC